MKRLLVITALLCLALTGCSVQERVNADVFLLRLTAAQDITAEPMYYEDDACFCFVTRAGLRAVLQCWETQDGYLKKIAVSAPGSGDAAVFSALCTRVLQTYAPGESAQALMNTLTAGEGVFHYAEGKTHRLCFAADTAGYFFSVTDAVLAPTEPPALTLRRETRPTSEESNAGN